jgi:hypothetical protein
MADPMIIDDGGSTRLKRIVQNGVGAMNGLLDVDDTANPPQSSETLNGPFSNVTVVTIDGNIVATTPVNNPISPNDTFTISSLNGQSVVVTITAGSGCVISVRGSQNNAPLVEAKQLKKKRRYVVINAGPIQSITVVLSGTSTNISTAGNLYSTLVLT